ncbi:MAG: DNA-directed RNA polymerase subunit omega [Tissierellaceae bacterium]|jgi:DNA-directed RNA polymerase subunit omega|nr:DNA-directed RNA polymerase subunit omega [Tissierellia bacterium]
MLNPSFDHVLKEGDSRYTLVMLTAKRARQIVDGSKPLIETESHKPVTIAIEEIVAGKVKYENPPTNSIK